MANYTTTADIHAAILFEAGELASGSDFDDEVLRLINRSNLAVAAGGAEFAPEIHEDWLWLRPAIADREVFNLNIAIDAGTVSVTAAGTSATLSSAPTPSVAGWHFKVDGETDVYRISAHTGGSATLTLDAAYTGDTDTAASYKLFQLDYAFSKTMLRPVSPLIIHRSQWASANEGSIDGIDIKEFNRKWPLRLLSSMTPTEFTVMRESDGILTIKEF